MFSVAAPIALLMALGAGAPTDGEDVIRAAYKMYAGKWFTTMTFVQKTTFPDAPTQTWYEAMELPGKLRIDIAPVGARAMLFRNDSIYNFADGKGRPGRPFVHSMLVLLGDMRVLPPEQTIAKLKGLGFDLTKTHETDWNGKTVIVVGAAKGDSTSKQFWLEKERMLTVRLIEPAGANRMMDARFDKYGKEGDAWVEREILIYMNGVLSQGEEYTQVKTNVTHEAGLFEPTHDLKKAAWVGEGIEIFK